MSSLKQRMVRDGHLGGYIPGGDPGTWCPHLWRWVVERLGIESVLDVGCGEGHSTRFFSQLGCEVLGVDGCQTAIDNSVVPGHVTLHDFCQGPLASPRSFDLVWSCEFLEHVDAKHLRAILGTFALARKAIMVTHAFPGQEDGHHHVNCQPSSYWIHHIESLGFECSVATTLDARHVTLADYPGINHFARSGLLFLRKETSLASQQSWLPSSWRERLVDYRINWAFRFSSAYRAQKRRRRAQKRLAAQQRVDAPHERVAP